MKNPVELVPIGDFATDFAEAHSFEAVFEVSQGIRDHVRPVFDPKDPDSRFDTFNKVEINALTAVIIDRLLNAVMAGIPDFPPYGFRAENRDPCPFPYQKKISLDRILFENITSTLCFYLDDIIKHPENYDLTHIMKRFQSVCLYSNRSPNETNAHDFISRGVVTAAKAAVNILVLADSFSCTAAPEGFSKRCPALSLQIARNSFPLLAQLASLDIEAFSQLNYIICGYRHGINARYSSEYFSLENEHEGSKIVLRHDVLKNIFSQICKLSPALFPRTGCPAHVKIGNEPSALRKFWDWIMMIAPDFYAALEQIRREDS